MRVDHWPQILASKIEEWRPRAFEWGTGDCFQFVADMVLALTGVDHREAFGQYTTEAEALAIIEAAGGVEAMLTACLGEPKPVAFAMRGDVVAFPADHGLSPAICIGVASAGIAPAGMVFQQTMKATMAWAV